MKISPLASLQKKVFPDKACKKHWKQELTVQTLIYCTLANKTETFKMCLFKSQNLFYQRAKTANVNAINASN